MSNAIKLLGLLIGAAIVAVIVRVVIVHSQRATPLPVAMVKVRIAAADLPVGLLLRDEDLGWKSMPQNQVPQNAVVAGSPGAPDLKGALLRHVAASGTVLLTTDVMLTNAPGFLAATLKPGMRAVSVAVDDVSGNAGLIQPGDDVDLLLTQQMSGRTDSPDLAVSSETIVEHVRVLAVGSEFQRPKDGDTPDGGNRTARTVTLEVTPRMGEVVAVAARLGSLSLALCSFATEMRDPNASATVATTQTTQSQPVWAGDISRAVRELPPRHASTAPGGAPADVLVYRGSERSDSGTAVVAGAGAGVPALPPLPVNK
jgi:pilus assembly protein CpaB